MKVRKMTNSTTTKKYQQTAKLKTKNPVLILIIIFLILSLFIIIYFFITWLINYDKTATLDYYLAPNTATFTIDQKTYQSDGKLKLKPGNYTIKIVKAGFQEITKDLELKYNQTTYLYETLEPDSSHSDYYKTHPEDESRVQHIADFKADLERKNYTDSDPVFKITPYSSYQAGFSIAAEKQSQTSKIKLKINLFTCSDQQIEELKTAAYQYLKTNQINPDNYDIEISSC